MTLSEKILARSSSRETVARVWDPSKIVIVFDHRIPAESEETATTYCRKEGANEKEVNKSVLSSIPTLLQTLVAIIAAMLRHT